jgi:23S rRNA (adenine2503-C2)-methyltransferase
MAEERPNLLGLSRDKMEALFSELGEKPFRAQQIMQWIASARRA